MFRIKPDLHFAIALRCVDQWIHYLTSKVALFHNAIVSALDELIRTRKKLGEPCSLTVFSGDTWILIFFPDSSSQMYRGSWTSLVWDELCMHSPSVSWWNLSTSHSRIVHRVLPSAGPSMNYNQFCFTPKVHLQNQHMQLNHLIAHLTTTSTGPDNSNKRECEAQKHLAFFHRDFLKYHQISIWVLTWKR